MKLALLSARALPTCSILRASGLKVLLDINNIEQLIVHASPALSNAIDDMPQTLLEQWVRKGAQSSGGIGKVDDSTTTRPDVTTTNEPIEPSTTRPSSLPHKVSFVKPEKEDIPRLKRLNSLLLPIPYPESFYKEIHTDPRAQNLTLLAFWGDTPSDDASIVRKGQLIGAVRCRLLDSTGAPDSRGPMLYLSTLVLLSPYRSLGIASHMLRVLIERGIKEHGASSIGAHVWDANTTAFDWYQKRGFKEIGHEPDYYRKLEPHGAKIMSKDLSILDLTGG